MTSEEKAKALAGVVDAIYDVIKASGPAGIPSGHLYAMLMGKVGLSQYQGLIAILLNDGRVKQSNFLLTAV